MRWVANPEAMASTLEKPIRSMPVAQPASCVPKFPRLLIGNTLARIEKLTATTVAKKVGVNPIPSMMT